MTTQECPPVIPLEPDEPIGSEEFGLQNEEESSSRPRAIGKNKTVVDVGNFFLVPDKMLKQDVTPFERARETRTEEGAFDWVDYSTSGFGGTRISDRFRFESKSYWRQLQVTANNNENRNSRQFEYFTSNAFRKGGNRRVSFVNNNSLPFSVALVGQPRDWNPNEGTQGDDILSGFYKKQVIQIHANQRHFSDDVEFSPINWRKWVEGGETAGILFAPLFNTEKTFYDHTYITTIPFFPKELEKVNNINKPSIAKIESEYNYRIPRYEVALANMSISGKKHEPILPNMYVMLMDEKSQGLFSSNSTYKQHLTLNDNISLFSGQGASVGMMGARRMNVDTVGIRRRIRASETESGQYFEKWGQTYDKISTLNTISNLTSRFRKLIFSPNDLEILNSYNEKRFLFPMYVDLQFSTDRETSLADSIQESQLTTSLMKTVASGLTPLKSFVSATQTFTNVGQPVKQNSIQGLSGGRERKTLDLTGWYFSRDARFLDSVGSVMMGTSQQEVFATTPGQHGLAKTILSLIFSGKFREILKNKLRTFEEVMDGKPAYSETMFYKIVKYEANRFGQRVGDPVQEIFVPNSSDLDVFRYIDTQILYNKRYRYVVYAYEAVFGTKYQYKLESGRNNFALPNSSIARAEVFMSPSIQLIETPIVSMSTMVLDKPPLPPEVDIVPYKNVNNQLLFNFNSVVGETTAMPIVFNQEEAENIARLREKNDLEPNSPIEYKTDDVMEYIEIFRTTFKPREYSDFEGFFHKRVETDLNANQRDDFNQDVEAFLLPSVSTIEDLSPNVKYYYTFRGVDFRGNISNPTPVYLVELDSRDGVSFPRIKIVDLEIPKQKKSTRKMKKYIKISPSVIQTGVDILNDEEAESAYDAEISLGNIEDSLFARYPQKNKIKLRLVSKHTGKKIDINLNFTHKHNR